MNTTLTDITARDRRICATYNSYRAKPYQHRRHRGHKTDALMHTARTWKMPISEVRTILETAEALKLGVDPKQYSAEKKAERQAKKTAWQDERDAYIRAGVISKDSEMSPALTGRLLDFLGI